MKCKCQDSYGKECGKPMTVKEYEQDGMCGHCADNVWMEIQTKDSYVWKHEERTYVEGKEGV